VMDETHLMVAARYVALNPVRAKLVAQAQNWPWSSARAHLAGQDDGLVSVAPVIERVNGRFADLLETEAPAAQIQALRMGETVGRPVGSGAFLDELSMYSGRDLRPKRRGPKPTVEDHERVE